MKSKKYIPIITAIIALFASIFLASCTGYRSISGIEIKNKETIEVVSGDFDYEDIKVIITYSAGDTREITLTEDMIPDTDKLNFFKLGEHEIRVIYNETYLTTMKINVVNDDFDDIYKLEDLTCDYDGQPHKIEINYELPEGATVEYPYGNTFTNAGQYDIVAVISKQGYNSRRLEAKLTINKAQYDLSKVVFEDKTFTYDGSPKNEEVVVSNIPQGVLVDYEVYNADKSVKLNNATDAGTYTIVAKFSSNDENYDQMSTREAKLTINKAIYDMTSVGLDDATKVYDGKPFQPKLTNESVVPQGVTTKFTFYNQEGKEVESCISAGEYKVVASFEGNAISYEPIEPIEAKLTITKRQVQLDGVVSLNSETVNFDRETHSLKVEGKIPNNVTVTYDNNDQKAAGEYKVIAHFTDSDPNEELDITQLEAYLIINKINESIQVLDEDSGKARALDANDLKLTVEQLTGKKEISIKGFIDDKYEIETMTFTTQPDDQNPEGKVITNIDDFSDGVKYNYNIVVAFKDQVENDSVTLAPATGTVSYEIKFDDDYKLEDLEIEYDGKAHGLKINKELPVGTKVEYPNGEEFTNYNKDPYTVIWKLSKDTYRATEIKGKLTIKKATYDMSKVKFENVTREYDGNNYTPTDKNSPTYNKVFDNLPEGVTVESVEIHLWHDGKYEDTATEFTSNIGKYRVDITFKANDSDPDTGNYNQVAAASYELEITPKAVDLSAVKLENLEIAKTGKFVFNAVTGTPMKDGFVLFVPDGYIFPDTYQPFPRSNSLPEGVNVIYTYMDSNNTVIATVDTNKKFKIVSYTEIHMADDENGTNDVAITLPIEAGTYTVTATFTCSDSNYAIPDNSTLTATLTITA